MQPFYDVPKPMMSRDEYEQMQLQALENRDSDDKSHNPDMILGVDLNMEYAEFIGATGTTGVLPDAPTGELSPDTEY